MIKLFEEWAQGENSFKRVSATEFDENEDSVQIREVDKKRIKLFFKNWEFREDTNPYIHMTNVEWSHFVYLLVDSAKNNYLLFWKDEADYYFVFHFTLHAGLPAWNSVGGFYKCDLLDGFEDLKNYLEKKTL